MSDPLFEQDNDATPLSEEEREGLIPSYITLRHELNDAEFANIAEAESWAFARKRNVLNEAFLNNLHTRMFGRVWGWAGEHRRSDKSVGIDWRRISVELRQLLDDCRYWVENASFEPDEIAARFHHKLVWIHPYPNGNGRHSRLATDLLLVAMDRERFSWGQQSLIDAGETRTRYVSALRAADGYNFRPLLAFVRS